MQQRRVEKLNENYTNTIDNKQQAQSKFDSIFGSKKPDNLKNIFGNTANLFGKSNKPQANFSFFNFNNNPEAPVPDPTIEQDQIQINEEHFLRAQQMPIDKNRSTGSYVYRNDMKIITTLVVKKFKKDGGTMNQNVEISIAENKNKSVYFVARFEATKVQLVTGILLKGKSTIRNFNQNAENIEISIFSLERMQNRLSKHIIKMQLQNSEEGKKLFDLIAAIIK